MQQPTYEKHLLKKLKSVQQGQRPPRQVLQSLYARMMMEYTVHEQNKARLKQRIDQALDDGDYEAFMHYTSVYNEWRETQQIGKMISEQGYELELTFDVDDT
ncbi:IDEAL domain-containing protein [Salsuginibacillus halophilus]|uniref:IDEAL domain-containing protein n=1 Tax=Salsuginibacillus halophilus TaxID=517424 RepID=A0A2P8HXP7_9BACI|nr:IDEAL domain-containing protein [Salsuginibacillus halophilus]PSL50978.1 IDEAL domain-containing protein [Salsuginibacillus halophilus]